MGGTQRGHWRADGAAIVIIGPGCLFKPLRGWLLLIGFSLFAGAIAVSELFAFSYGKDECGTVTALGTQLLSNPTLPQVLHSRLGPNASLFLSSPINPNGHRYLALNRLPCAGVKPQQIASLAAADLDSVFPIIATGESGKAVKAGNVFVPGFFPGTGRNPVTSSDLHGHYFVLTTRPDHWLRGSASHGIARDSSGGLWLFQFGQGPPNEEPYKQLLAYPLAKKMWSQMASNLGASCAVSPSP